MALARFPRDFVCLTLLLGLAGWVWHDQIRLEKYDDLLSTDIQMTRSILSFHTEMLFAQATKAATEQAEEAKGKLR